MAKFVEIFLNSKLILTEGAFVERLKAEFGVKPDNYINHAGLLYSDPKMLEILYRQYIDVAQKYELPVMITTPTRRVNNESVPLSEFNEKNIITDCITFLKNIKNTYKEPTSEILIGGLLGCRGDAYCGKRIMNIEESFTFHRKQTLHFENNEIDFLFAGIMPEINEATGMAMAMAETNIPYIISFMLQKDGCLMDGTPLAEAICIMDEKLDKKPVCYATNCIHPTNLILALNNPVNKNKSALSRFSGIQANASMLCPKELNNCSNVEQDDFDNIISEMVVLHRHYEIKILGGCCGTDDIFMDGLASKLLDS